MSSSNENEYFSDGITEEIINALAKINQLRVSSRTSSFFFKNKKASIIEIGQALKVSTLLEGSVRLSGNTIRITAQLIDAVEDFHFWSETWDRKLDNIFGVQDEISLIIADKLREHFGHFEIQEHLVSRQTNNLNAYEYSLKAKYYKNKWNPQDVKKAISLYEKALELDLKHTESYVGLADCYSFLGTTAFLPYQEAWSKTIQYTQQAFQLNDQLSGVHYQLSNIAFFTNCDYNTSLREMQKAIDLNPNNAEAHQFISYLYIIAGERNSSQKHLDIAININPLSQETQFFVAYYHYMIEDFQQCLELLDKCLQANNKSIPAHSVKTLCLLMLGKYNEVISYFDSVPSEVVVLGEKTGSIALAYALKGDEENTSRYLRKLELQGQSPDGFTAHSYLFLMYVVLGNFEKAFEWIAEAVKNKFILLMIRYSDPLIKPIKEDPRYLTYQKLIFKTQKKPTASLKKKELLDSNLAETYTATLLDHVEKNKPYLNPELSLRTLAKQLKISPNQLSWLLNEKIGKNFNAFINHYRVETFMSLVKNPKNATYTLLGLAFESGFNSKTVFNTYFKKETGLTPKQFIQQLQK